MSSSINPNNPPPETNGHGTHGSQGASGQNGHATQEKKSAGGASNGGAAERPAGAAPVGGFAPLFGSPARASAPDKLSVAGRASAVLVLIVWMNLFAGGYLISSEPYRCKVDPTGVRRLVGYDEKSVKVPDPCPGVTQPARGGAWFGAWGITLVTFIPFNLALLCASAGLLGAFGNKAKLHPEEDIDRVSRDRTNPHVSALLRGFFVYLFIISGLLVFDDNPFSGGGPGQYIRLAGFTSLFSFLVNYNPTIFNPLIEWAYQKVQPSGAAKTVDVKVGAGARAGKEQDGDDSQAGAMAMLEFKVPGETPQVRVEEPEKKREEAG